METLERMIMRNDDVIISQPRVRLEKKDVTIVNPNPSADFVVYAPNVAYAVWNLRTEECIIPTNLTIAASIYLPGNGDYNSKNVKCERCAPDTKGVTQGYQILFDFPDNEQFDYYQLYDIVITDALDVLSIGMKGTEFIIEVFLSDTDPKTSRGTVTTVLKSA